MSATSRTTNYRLSAYRLLTNRFPEVSNFSLFFRAINGNGRIDHYHSYFGHAGINKNLSTCSWKNTSRTPSYPMRPANCSTVKQHWLDRGHRQATFIWFGPQNIERKSAEGRIVLCDLVSSKIVIFVSMLMNKYYALRFISILHHRHVEASWWGSCRCKSLFKACVTLRVDIPYDSVEFEPPRQYTCPNESPLVPPFVTRFRLPNSRGQVQRPITELPQTCPLIIPLVPRVEYISRPIPDGGMRIDEWLLQYLRYI